MSLVQRLDDKPPFVHGAGERLVSPAFFRWQQSDQLVGVVFEIGVQPGKHDAAVGGRKFRDDQPPKVLGLLFLVKKFDPRDPFVNTQLKQFCPLSGRKRLEPFEIVLHHSREVFRIGISLQLVVNQSQFVLFMLCQPVEPIFLLPEQLFFGG